MFDAQKASAIILKAQKYCDDYIAQHSAEANQAKQTMLKTRVLPGLSIYIALLEEKEDQEKILAQVDTLFRAAFFIRRMQGIRVLNFLSDPFPLENRG